MTAHHEDLNAISPDMHDDPDAWHRHTADERPQHAHGEVANAPKIIAVGGALFFLVGLTIFVIYWFYIGLTTTLLNEQESFGLEADQLKTKAAVQADMRTYTWVPPSSTVPVGTVEIPEDKARTKVVQEYLK